MSLMNDMLRDLEARDASPPVESVRHTGPDRRPRWALPVLGGIALLATGLLTAWLILDTPADADIPAGAGALPDRDAAVGAVSDRDPPRTQNESPTDSAPAPEPARAVGAVSDRDSSSRTTNEPPTDSAPAPEPTHAAGAVSDRDSSRTQTESPADSAPAPEPTHAAGAVSDRDASSRTATESPTDSAPAAKQSTNTIVVRPAARSRDATAQDLDSARRALARGQTGVAISRLQALLERRPDLAEARILLARTLLASGRPQRAEALLADGLADDPVNHELAFWLARNRLEQNRPEVALQALQAQSPAVGVMPDFHLLLGATLRQLERHEQALETYRRITEALPGNARGWLGRALSAEELGLSEPARAAYRRALEHGDARIQRLARQRLNALPRDSQGIK